MTDRPAIDLRDVLAGAYLQAAMDEWLWRKAQLGYIRDVRQWLDSAERIGMRVGVQEHRDRWSALCRKLCVDGKPVLALARNHPDIDALL